MGHLQLKTIMSYNSHFFPGYYSIIKVELKGKKSNTISPEEEKRIKDLPLPVILIHLLRNLIWTQGFPINYINGIKDLIPAENMKYLRNLFSQMTHY